jgi:DNA-binding response OmpR family regulator
MFTAMKGELYEMTSRDAGADELIQKTIPIQPLIARMQRHICRFNQNPDSEKRYV